MFCSDITANSTVVNIRVKNGNMCFCSAYLPPNDPATALSTMYSIYRNLSMIATPWIVAGDWNLTPEELLDKEWDVMAKVHVSHPMQNVLRLKAMED